MAIANALAFLLYLSSSAILIRRFVRKDQAALMYRVLQEDEATQQERNA